MRVVILGSGRGSNAEAILQAQQAGQLGAARVVQILSDKADAGILALGPRFGVPARYVDPAPFKTKLEGEGEERFIAAVTECIPDLVVLAGFMRVLKPKLLAAFSGKIINLHPSLLPAFPGLDGIGQALRAGVKATGCTVHYVTAEVDAGGIIEQAEVPVDVNDTLESLTAKVHAAEHRLLPEVIAQLSTAKKAAGTTVYEFRVEVALGAVLAIEEALAEHEEQSLMVLEDKPSGRAWLAGYYASREEAAAGWKGFAPVLEAEWLVTEPAINQLADKDWKESYKEHFKAWKFGRLHWVPVWEQPAFQLPPGEEVLWLDPGMAFGTGNHETTRLVVERLVAIAAARGTAGRVIDAGCGSGILALSAAKLGFSKIAAFDNDPLAIEVSQQNADLNGLSGQVEFYVGDLVTGLAGRQAELLLANIQADVLLKFSTELLQAVAPAGTLVLSGILAAELAQVREGFAAAAPGWTIDSRALGEWSDLVLAKP
ncbi:MAG: phosphoribosylglycinamide formyltransferase [Lacunisphaera sp.]